MATGQSPRPHRGIQVILPSAGKSRFPNRRMAASTRNAPSIRDRSTFPSLRDRLTFYSLSEYRARKAARWPEV